MWISEGRKGGGCSTEGCGPQILHWNGEGPIATELSTATFNHLCVWVVHIVFHRSTILMTVKKCLAAFTFGNAGEQIRSREDGKAVQGLAVGEI